MAVSVKDFLDAIRGRFNDEPNKVEVTGSNIVTIASWIENTNHRLFSSTPTRYGATISGNAPGAGKIDVSNYINRIIYFRNDLNVSVSLNVRHYYTLDNVSDSGGSFSEGFSLDLSSGSSVTLTKDTEDFEALGMPLKGMLISVTSNASSGNVTIIVNGGN